MRERRRPSAPERCGARDGQRAKTLVYCYGRRYARASAHALAVINLQTSRYQAHKTRRPNVCARARICSLNQSNERAARVSLEKRRAETKRKSDCAHIVMNAANEPTVSRAHKLADQSTRRRRPPPLPISHWITFKVRSQQLLCCWGAGSARRLRRNADRRSAAGPTLMTVARASRVRARVLLNDAHQRARTRLRACVIVSLLLLLSILAPPSPPTCSSFRFVRARTYTTCTTCATMKNDRAFASP